MPSSAVNESWLPRLTSATVISLCLLLYEHPPQGCASKTALLFFFIPFPTDSARRQTILRRRKVLIWGREKVLTWEARARKLRDCSAFYLPPTPRVSPFFRAPGGNTQWAACLCCCVPTLCRAPPLSEATQHGAKGHAGMPIMQCGNCDCFWFKWFQMRLFGCTVRNSWLLWLLICTKRVLTQRRRLDSGRILPKHGSYPYVPCFVM